jgi:hypothetical protein
VSAVDPLFNPVKPGVDAVEPVRVVIDDCGQNGNGVLQAGNFALQSLDVALDADI